MNDAENDTRNKCTLYFKLTSKKANQSNAVFNQETMERRMHDNPITELLHASLAMAPHKACDHTLHQHFGKMKH